MRTGDRFISRKILIAVGYPDEEVYEGRILNLMLEKSELYSSRGQVSKLDSISSQRGSAGSVASQDRAGIFLALSTVVGLPQFSLTFAAEREQLLLSKIVSIYFKSHCATSRTVSGSIPGVVSGDFFRSYRQNHVPWG